MMKIGRYALQAGPPVWNEFRQILHAAGADIELGPIERSEFYKRSGTPDVVLTIATGEQAIFANLLLTVGVVRP